MIKKILDAVANTTDLYYRLVLLADTENDHMGLAGELSEHLGTEVVNVNYELSKQLLHQTARQRKLHLSKSLAEIVQHDKVILLDHTEILFDVELGQDPLRLLELLSRNQAVIAFWSGRIKDGKLIYAEQGHPEYRSYAVKDVTVIEIDKEKGEI